MKKVILAVALLAMAGLASAVDVGVYGGTARGTNGKSENLVGLSLGDNLGKLGLKDFGIQEKEEKTVQKEFRVKSFPYQRQNYQNIPRNFIINNEQCS